jgi:hypothetical protein
VLQGIKAENGAALADSLPRVELSASLNLHDFLITVQEILLRIVPKGQYTKATDGFTRSLL